jgi:hypothetical protein
MESIKTFAHTDMGLILGAVFLFMGISSYVVFQFILLPKLKERNDEKTQKAIALLYKVSIFECIGFSLAGSLLLFWHFSG